MIQLRKLLILLLFILGLTLLFSCERLTSLTNNPVGETVNKTEEKSQEKKKEVVRTGIGNIFKSDLNAVKESFDVKFQMDSLNENEYNLTVFIILNGDAYIISPFSKDTTYGHFYFTIEESDYLISDDKLLETPPSVEEFDPVLESPVKFVRVNTTYQKKLKLSKQGGFEVAGIVEFLLEPICIPYDVEFIISYQNGKMKVKKTKTVISGEYKM